jgi:hypothetical protein
LLCEPDPFDDEDVDFSDEVEELVALPESELDELVELVELDESLELSDFGRDRLPLLEERESVL